MLMLSLLKKSALTELNVTNGKWIQKTTMLYDMKTGKFSIKYMYKYSYIYTHK